MTASVPLNPLDDLVAVCDETMRHSGQPGFNCVQVVVFDGRVDRERLMRSVDRLARRHPLTTARLGHPWWSWRPRWIIEPAGAIPVDLADGGAAASAPAQLAAEILNRPLDPRCDPPVQVFLRRGPTDGDVFGLKWSHVLADARGGDFLVRELGRIYGGEEVFRESAAPLRPVRLRVPLGVPFWPVRFRRSRGVFCPWISCSGGRVRLKGMALDEVESQRAREAAGQVAGFARLPVFLLAAYLCALRREALRGGRADALLRTCWPVGLREGPVLDSMTANEYGVLYVECPATEAAELGAVVERLTREIISQLGAGEHRRFWQTGRWFKIASYPFLRLVNRRSRLLLRGSKVSTDFRYRGRLLDGARRWGGIAVAGGFSATLCWPEKPVAVSVSETAGRFYIGATWLEGAIAEAALDRLMADFRSELLAGPR